MKRLIVLAATLLAAAPAAAEFPEREIRGVIQWGAGGSTDTVMRSVTPHAEEVLGTSIVMQNVTGGVGAIALNQVAEADPDGYTLLMGAENPTLYKVMNLGERDYADFVPVVLLARGTPMLVASANAPFDDYAGMMSHIAENPGDVRFGSTGPGGLSSVILAMVESIEGDLDIIEVPYGGDGPALTALQGGAIDVMPVVVGAAIEGIRAGTMKPITVMDAEAHYALPDVQPVTEAETGYEAMLPWGPFFGVFAPVDTPKDVVAKLSDAYRQAAEQDDFRKLMQDRGFIMMNVSGAEAQAYLDSYQRNTVWLIEDAGLAKRSPEEFGIPRPEK
ncbi:tripartite tricarboxylate transporter substrate binding protein [Roseovarius dicentrarchi]|uniref:tripartite tricarboxylate transporter substrate binding protein n=1 Tax=Roseovarius dicentrarchi TaxID=2250573 RepID=UPI000DE8ED6E|nr:tripartite tricarboxylate transporter substrate binding protein [Roseovarius dicentrarchi]